MTQSVSKILKDRKIPLPITKEGFMKLCNALNMHCTEVLAFEGMIYCRGQKMEEGPAEEFDFDRMVNFLIIKSKQVAPASNPRIALTTKNRGGQFFNQLKGTQGSLPALRQTVP